MKIPFVHRIYNLALWACALAVPVTTHAQIFTGGDLTDGIPLARNIRTGGELTPGIREAAIGILYEVLSYVGIVAVIVIIIAGLFLILGFGSDESRQRAQKIVFWTIIGLLVIIFAASIVAFVIDIASGVYHTGNA